MYKLCNYSYISYLHNFFTIHFWLSLRFCQIANGCGQLWVTSVNQMYGAMFWFWSSEVQQRPKPLDMSSASFGILRHPSDSKVFQGVPKHITWVTWVHIEEKKGRHANCLETRFESWFPPQVKKKAPCSCLSISIWVLACQQKFGGVAYISQLPSGSTWALEASLPER